MGTPHYMSPEQISGAQVDQRSDLDPLRTCALRNRHRGTAVDLDDAWAILVGHRDTPPSCRATTAPSSPRYFERIILDLLAKEPERRPQDARELGRRIGTAAPLSVYVPTVVSPAIGVPPTSGACGNPRRGVPHPFLAPTPAALLDPGMTTGHKATVPDWAAPRRTRRRA